MVPTGGELGGQCLADVLRGTGDHRAGVGTGSGDWHGPIVGTIECRHEQPGVDAQTRGQSRVVAWALWDTGATGVNAIVVTFVFSVYLTGQVGAGMPGPPRPRPCSGTC